MGSRKARAIMVQGTASNVGKSVLCTGLCRLFARQGFRTAPFKAQNMALNSYVTPSGYEIGRSQGVQAEAAQTVATVEMNPILLKPKGDSVAQVVVMGRPLADMTAQQYRNEYVPEARKVVRQALETLQSHYDIIVIEGAGSPAEINLKDRDIVNMWTAQLAGAPVILAGDIDRGGVFASLLGTLELLCMEERARILGLVINKFRGDESILAPGLKFLEDRTQKPVLGVLPYVPELGIEAEDSLGLPPAGNGSEYQGSDGTPVLEIAVLVLPRISNFTDLDPLIQEPGVRLHFVRDGRPLGEPDAVIIPGTKNTIADLMWLRDRGYEDQIRRLAAASRWIVGICGGYQVLGRYLHDPDRLESEMGDVPGIGLLEVETTFASEKLTHQVAGNVIGTGRALAPLAGIPVTGYEIHMGRTRRGPGTHPLVRLQKRSGRDVDLEDGCVSQHARVFGTYIHGIFDNDRFRRGWLDLLRAQRGLPSPGGDEQQGFRDRRLLAFDRLADLLEDHLDLRVVYKALGLS